MAGVKGRSGRKPKTTAVTGETPLELLLAFARDPSLSVSERIRAAGLAAQYVHHKRGEGGKKEAAADAAKKIAKGKFAPSKPPLRLVGNN